DTNTVVSGPAVDGNNWNGLATFLYASSTGLPNLPPTAAATHECTANVCQFDGSTSGDADGTITSYLWDFGDGTTPGVGSTATHAYSTPGTYVVTLTVTDDRGASSATTLEVTV